LVNLRKNMRTSYFYLNQLINQEKYYSKLKLIINHEQTGMQFL